MRNFDVSEILPKLLSDTFIGFDHPSAAALHRALRPETFPPTTVTANEDGSTTIVMAVAGYKPSDIEVYTKEGFLHVVGTGEKDDTPRTKHVVYGNPIARRSFDRTFKLYDYATVESASLENGLLTIEVKRELPELLRRKDIVLTTTAPAIEDNVADGDEIENESSSKDKQLLEG